MPCYQTQTMQITELTPLMVERMFVAEWLVTICLVYFSKHLLHLYYMAKTEQKEHHSMKIMKI